MHKIVYKCSGNNVYVYIYIYIHWQYWHTHIQRYIMIYTCIHDAIIFQTHFSKHLHGLCFEKCFLWLLALWGRCSFLACFGGSHQPMALVESFRSLLLCWVGECNMAADPALIGWDSQYVGALNGIESNDSQSFYVIIICFFYYDSNNCFWFLMISNDLGKERWRGCEGPRSRGYSAICCWMFRLSGQTCLTKTICFDLFW